MLKAVEGFDGIVVSTRRDLESLVRSGYHGKAFQVYPYVDPAEWKGVQKSELERLKNCLLYTSPSPRDGLLSRMPSSA